MIQTSAALFNKLLIILYINKIARGVNMTDDRKIHFLINTFYFLTVASIVYFALKLAVEYLLPFVIGFIITAMIQPIVMKISKRYKIKNDVLSVAMVILIYVTLALLTCFLGYKIYIQLVAFAKNLPNYILSMTDLASKTNDKFLRIFDDMPDDFKDKISTFPDIILKSLTDKFRNMMSAIVGGIAKGMPAAVVTIIITLVASVFIAKDYNTFLEFTKSILDENHIIFLGNMKEMLYKNVIKILRGYLTLMFITFIELSVCLLFLRVDYAIAVAALISLVDILPVLGTGSVMIPWAIIKILSGDINFAVSLIVIYVIISIVRNILEPKIIGKQMGLHPLVTLIAMFLGLKIFGIIGMFILPILLIILNNLFLAKRAVNSDNMSKN